MVSTSMAAADKRAPIVRLHSGVRIYIRTPALSDQREFVGSAQASHKPIVYIRNQAVASINKWPSATNSIAFMLRLIYACAQWFADGLGPAYQYDLMAQTGESFRLPIATV